MRGVFVVLLACVTAVMITGRAPTRAQPAPDLDRARTLYAGAEKALADARYEEALDGYRGAYRISKDAALLYKMAVVFQRTDRCSLAVQYFAAYLKHGKPSPDFFALTRERIRQCNADPDTVVVDRDAPLRDAAEEGSGVGSGSAPATTGSGSGSAGSADPGPGSDVAVASGSGSAVAAPIKGKHRVAWILIGGAIATATIGAVLAYSANAAETDIDDLYVGLGGNPPAFNEATRDRFDDLVAEGKRYQTLSWVSFGVAGVLGGLATWRFATAKESKVQVAPTVSPTSAGLSAGFRF